MTAVDAATHTPGADPAASAATRDQANSGRNAMRADPGVTGGLPRVTDPRLLPIVEKVQHGERLSATDGLLLFETPDVLTVGRLAENARNRAVSLRAQVDRELSRFCKDGIRTDFCRLFKRNTSVRVSQ